MDGAIYQQDGASEEKCQRNTREVRAYLKDMFEGRLISRYDHFYWPARSPDLNPCDYYLWARLKDFINQFAPQTVEELEIKIYEFFDSFSSPEMADERKRSIYNFGVRCQALLSLGGKHVATKKIRTEAIAANPDCPPISRFIPTPRPDYHDVLGQLLDLD